MHSPAALPAIALAAGIAVGIFVPVDHAYLILIHLVACWTVALVAMRWRFSRTFLCFIAMGFVSAGALLGAQANNTALHAPLGEVFDQHVLPHQYQRSAGIEGTLQSDAARGPNGVTLNIDVDQIDLDGRRQATAGGAIIGVGGELGSNQQGAWRAGRRVRLPATLRRPATYLDPGVPDARREFGWRGTALVGSAKSDRLVEVIARGTLLSEALAAVRGDIRRAVSSAVAPWDSRSAAVVVAILIGDRAGLDEDMQRQLQEAGTYHVIAISGGNIAIFAGLWVMVLRRLRVGPRLSALAIILALLAYAGVVEGGSSVGRATLMAVGYFLAQIGDHRCRPANVASASALLLFCAHPLEVVDAGFALTFGATLGLLVGMPRLHRPAAMPGWVYAGVALLAASVCAEIALLPVAAFAFSRVTAAGLILNFAAIPLMTVVQIAGMAVVGLAHVSSRAALWAGFAAHLGVKGLLASAALVDVMPWLARRVPPPAIGLVAAYYLSLILALAAKGRARQCAACACAFCGWWIAVEPVVADGGGRLLRVTFIDVGQGDGAIVQFPDGRTLSVDAGGIAGTTFDIGSRVVSPAYWSLGVRRLDYMSISHGDSDHIGGAASVFRDFRPREVWEGVPVPPLEPAKQLRILADAAAVPWRTLQSGDRLSVGDVQLLVHHPPPPEWERQRVRNDDSEVLELVYRGVSLVFAGDIGREVEHAIAPSFERRPIRILKVPHHGSATSSSTEFLRALRPAVAVISAGRGNQFGHPVQSVLDGYTAIGAAIYRTDLDGAVTVETDGRTVRVRTYTDRRLTLRTH